MSAERVPGASRGLGDEAVARCIESPFISIQPGMMFGRPTICGFRMEAEQVASMWLSGWELDSLKDNWAELEKPSILVCCWYMGRYGSRSWKKRLGAWADEAEGFLWKGDYDIPLPPPERKPDA